MLNRRVFGCTIRDYVRHPSTFWWNLRWVVGYKIGGFTHARRADVR